MPSEHCEKIDVMITGMHNEYLDALLDGALLCEEHEEVQRELTQLLATLLQLLPLLRDLNFLVRSTLVLSTVFLVSCSALCAHLAAIFVTDFLGMMLTATACKSGPSTVAAAIADDSAASCIPSLSSLASWFSVSMRPS